MKIWLLIPLFLVSHNSYSAERTSFREQISVQGVGTVEVDYEYSGDSVMYPALLTFRVRCNNSPRFVPIKVAKTREEITAKGQFRLDGINRRTYDSGKKSLSLEYTLCRPTERLGTVCDQSAPPIEIPFANACSGSPISPIDTVVVD